MSRYQDKILDILANAKHYHSVFYETEPFGGPCLYFHRRALESRHSTDFTRHLEYVYATLTSWGMHRMGRGGGKMLDFDSFEQSVAPLKNKIKEAERIDCANKTESDWKLLEELFKGIKVMATGTSIVGNSKVMAHMIPNIIPPIDRQYTLWYLQGNTNIQNGLDREWVLMRRIVEGFFIPVGKDSDFCKLAKQWTDNQEDNFWDTSIFKVIDNLVIGARQAKQ